MSNNETLTHNPSHLLEVNHLKTYFKQHGSVVKAIDDVTFHVDEGEVLGIVGESGCGKSVTSLSIMKLLSEDALYHTDGKIIFDGESITDKTEKGNMPSYECQQRRGKRSCCKNAGSSFHS